MDYEDLEEIAEKIDNNKEFRKEVTNKVGITEDVVRNYIKDYLKNIFKDGEVKKYEVDYSLGDGSGELERGSYIRPTITVGNFLREHNGDSRPTYTSGYGFYHCTYDDDLEEEVREDFSELEFEAYKKIMKKRYKKLSDDDIEEVYGMLDDFFWDNAEMEFFGIFEKSSLVDERIIDLLNGEVEFNINEKLLKASEYAKNNREEIFKDVKEELIKFKTKEQIARNVLYMLERTMEWMDWNNGCFNEMSDKIPHYIWKDTNDSCDKSGYLVERGYISKNKNFIDFLKEEYTGAAIPTYTSGRGFEYPKYEEYIKDYVQYDIDHYIVKDLVHEELLKLFPDLNEKELEDIFVNDLHHGCGVYEDKYEDVDYLFKDTKFTDMTLGDFISGNYSD